MMSTGTWIARRLADVAARPITGDIAATARIRGSRYESPARSRSRIAATSSSAMSPQSGPAPGARQLARKSCGRRRAPARSSTASAPEEWPVAAMRRRSMRGPSVRSASSPVSATVRSGARRHTAKRPSGLWSPNRSPGWSTAAAIQPCPASASASHARFAPSPPLPCDRSASGMRAGVVRTGASQAPRPGKMPSKFVVSSTVPGGAGYQIVTARRRSRARSS
jgi:hypothetical protein